MLRGLRGEELVFSEYCWEFDEGVERKGIRRLEEEMRDWEGRVEGLVGGDEDEGIEYQGEKDEGEEEEGDGEDVCWAGEVEQEELEEEINEELELDDEELDEELVEALVKALEALEQLEEEELKQLEEEGEELEPEDLDMQRTFPDQADAEDGWVVVP